MAATQEISFTGAPGDSDHQRYEHISRVLKRFSYPALGKGERGVVLAYLRRTSGYSRSQITRLVGRWGSNRLAVVPLAKRYCRPAVPFVRKYTGADMDRANEDVCGVAIVHLLKRAFIVYGDQRYERLSWLSVSHLYNLRKSGGYLHGRAYRYGTTSSMSRRGNCWDNACSKMLFGHLKVERLDGQRFKTCRQARDEARAWMRWYSRDQLLSTPAYVSAAQLEQDGLAAQLKQANSYARLCETGS